ncbi:MAG: hypothetical protein KKA81_08560, partial [Bacteroidetes bacterium]|nr:hypothetical protein [Bacteroidota bacterium]
WTLTISDNITDDTSHQSINLIQLKSIKFIGENFEKMTNNRRAIKAELTSLSNEKSEWYIISPQNSLYGKKIKMGLEMDQYIPIANINKVTFYFPEKK